jgi:hypothetical protein
LSSHRIETVAGDAAIRTGFATDFTKADIIEQPVGDFRELRRGMAALPP